MHRANVSLGLDLHTGHKKLIFLFDPLSTVLGLFQTSHHKVLRWAVSLSIYNYTCFHIRGTDNVWADMLGRWSSPSTIRRIVKIPELPSSSSPDFIWPTMEELATLQQTYNSTRPEHFIFSDGLWKNPNSAIWIPDNAADMQLRLYIIAHTVPSGHRGHMATKQALPRAFFWKTITQDIRVFVRACIHCLSKVSRSRVSRPFGPAVHRTKPKDLLQFDYIELQPSQSVENYVLMFRDDHSDYKWFFAASDTTIETVAEAIIDWCAAFIVPRGLMADRQTHFGNETIRLILEGLKVSQHFTLSHCPCNNGAIERLGKDSLLVFPATLSKL